MEGGALALETGQLDPKCPLHDPLHILTRNFRGRSSPNPVTKCPQIPSKILDWNVTGSPLTAAPPHPPLRLPTPQRFSRLCCGNWNLVSCLFPKWRKNEQVKAGTERFPHRCAFPVSKLLADLILACSHSFRTFRIDTRKLLHISPVQSRI